MAKPRTEKKSQTAKPVQPPGTTRVLPMELQAGVDGTTGVTNHHLCDGGGLSTGRPW